jgi:hypothetical protein
MLEPSDQVLLTLHGYSKGPQTATQTDAKLLIAGGSSGAASTGAGRINSAVPEQIPVAKDEASE